MHGTCATELITGTFVGNESDPFQNLSQRNYGTNGLKINAGHGSSPLEPPAQYHSTSPPGYPKPTNREEEHVLAFLTVEKESA